MTCETGRKLRDCVVQVSENNSRKQAKRKTARKAKFEHTCGLCFHKDVTLTDGTIPARTLVFPGTGGLLRLSSVHLGFRKSTFQSQEGWDLRCRDKSWARVGGQPSSEPRDLSLGERGRHQPWRGEVSCQCTQLALLNL